MQQDASQPIEPSKEVLEDTVNRLLDELVARGSGTLDTLALMLNSEARKDIDQSRQEAQEGKRIPIEDILT